MTAPRQVLRGTTYLVTRRCSERRFFLRPDDATNQLFRYLLAVAADRFQVDVHAACVLSNHFHLVVTDREGRLPAFGQYLDSLLARSLNAAHGRWEHFWAPSSYSAVALESPEDILDKMAYALANPVAGALVRYAREWPGVWTSPDQIGGRPVTVRRPGRFFRAKGKMPEIAKLRLTVPPGFGSVRELRSRLGEVLAELEQEVRSELEKAKATFLGAKKVLAQRFGARPKTRERRRGLNPRVAAKDKWKRVEALNRLASFLEAYRQAWEQWRSGRRRVVFPAGTYWLAVAHGARRAPG